ncbi:hypothetical protein [Pseudoalteromonas luteoviolacea]|uniref:hypothetical protein n=1 Tax=Pseudoalteromonas luteoviolacea TaxID=43657 RepID=UPI00114DC515|nr:hypothetical protein [Pseudoalteromonas luteoviolacea]TQF69551.1 hypothetical protein FLM44_00085 [Pseudoalteromonas luteoviolacea]
MSLSSYLLTVRDVLAAQFPDLKECELHPGAVNNDELARIGASTPAMLVTLGYVEPKIDDYKAYDLPVIPMVYIVTSGRADQQLEDALNYIDGITDLIHSAGFGYECAHSASDVAAKNLFTSATGRHATSLWVIRWRQLIRVDTSEPEPQHPQPNELKIGIAPHIGADHETDYTKVDLS